MNAKFWNGKKVLVTGHTGFKGSWLCLWLQSMGAEVTGLALDPPSDPSMFDMARIADGMNSIKSDVRDLDSVKKIINQHKPEIVIHMAAQALVHYSYKDPVSTYTTNIIGTMNVLEAIRHCDSVRVVVSITSDKCYENLEWVWGYRENDRMGGHDPYSSSKGCAELLISAYRDSYFNPEKYQSHGVALASTRAGNVIGGGDWSGDRLVPDIIRAIIDDKPVLIRNPNAIRPWQFVMEPLRGYLMLAEKLWEEGPKYAEGWNFGPDIDEIKPVQWIVEYLTERWGEGASWVLDKGEHPHEDNFLKLDTTKAKSILEWNPSLPLPILLDWIVEWYQGYKHNEDMRDLTERQIVRYIKSIQG